MKYEDFKNEWQDLSTEDKVNLHNDYCREHDADNEIFEFTDDFLNEMFSEPAECARALFFGNVKNWCDKYIRFNGYANLVSMDDYEADDFCEMFVSEIYDHPELWQEYIDDDEDED